MGLRLRQLRASTPQGDEALSGVGVSTPQDDEVLSGKGARLPQRSEEQSAKRARLPQEGWEESGACACAYALRMPSSVVTGAGSGIGRATALALAARGHDVALLGRKLEPLLELAGRIVAGGRRAVALACDVSRSADVDAAAKEALAQLGAPHVVVNNAGVVKRAKVAEMREEDWDDVVGTSLKGTFLVTRAFLPSMLAERRGRVVSMGSISSTLGTAEQAAYNAAKWGVVGFTKSLAEELRGTALQAMCVMPGAVDTPMLAGSRWAPQMTADEVANVVVYAALDAPPAMNGSAVEMFGP
jgi:3-oxoacyl-[acyl-carrier protein] reductase